MMVVCVVVMVVILLGLACAPSATAAPTHAGYVQVDVANIRAEPKPGSAVVTKLRINTYVRASKASHGWARVDWIREDRPYPVEVGGWIHQSLLGEHPVKLDDLRREIEAQTSAPKRVKLLERAVALEPTQVALWEQLRDAYRAAQNGGAATRVQRILEGRAPYYLVRCDENSGAKLVGIVESSGKFRSLVVVDEGASRPADGTSIEELEKLRLELAGLPWFSFIDRKLRLLPGTPFAKPRLFQEDSAAGSTTWLTLGACTNGGMAYRRAEVLASQPLALVPARGAAAEVSELSHALSTLRAPLANGGKSEVGECPNPGTLRLRSIEAGEIPGTGIRDVTLVWQDSHGVRAMVRGLVDSRGKVLWPRGAIRATAGPGFWFRPLFGNDISVMSLVPYTDAACGAYGGYEGVCLHRVDGKNGLRSRCFTTYMWGC